MDYKQKWKWLKEWLEQAMDEAHVRGFDKGQGTFENGIFYGYHRTLEEMKLKDGEKLNDCN